MGMVAPQQRIASAFAVVFGHYGDVSRCAQQRGVCRQWLYRESAWVLATLEGTAWRKQIADLRQQVRDLEEQVAGLEQRLTQAVVLDREKQAEVACVAQAMGVLDEDSRGQVRQAAADEIYVTDPVLMVVEPESLCWVSGRLTEPVSGKAWAEEFRQLSA